MPRPLPVVPETLPGGLAWEDLMLQALDAAKNAAGLREVPVGAVLLDQEGKLLSKACNAPVSSNDPTAHAEIRCLRQACELAGNYRLPGTIMAVTLEPCLMCAGALTHARVAGVVYGTADPRTGALESRLQLQQQAYLNHFFWIKAGVLQDQCAALLQDFFRKRRQGLATGC